MNYNKFSYYYDLMMDNINYDIFTSIAKKYTNITNKILDAGCGTGNVLISLLKDGFDIEGIDLSDEMLAVADSKLKSEHINTKLYHQDLLDPLPDNYFDVVISFLDVINYIDDFKKVFKNIYSTLKEDGSFIFDVHTTKYVEELVGYSEVMEYDDFSYEWNVLKGDKKFSIVHDLKITTSSGEVFKEIHSQTTYHKETYIEALKEAGFKNIKVLKESDEYKTFIIAYK